MILEVDPQFQIGPDALNNIYVHSSTGQQVPLSALVHTVDHGGAARGQSSGPIPVGDDLVQPAPGVSIGEAVAAIQQIEAAHRQARRARDELPGQRAGVPVSSLSSTPMLIAAALVVVYIILGVLYESMIHPITILSTLPSAGHRRAADADGLPSSIST